MPEQKALYGKGKELRMSAVMKKVKAERPRHPLEQPEDVRRAHPLEPAHTPTMLVNRDVPGMVQAMVTHGPKGERLGPVENFYGRDFDDSMETGKDQRVRTGRGSGTGFRAALAETKRDIRRKLTSP